MIFAKRGSEVLEEERLLHGRKQKQHQATSRYCADKHPTNFYTLLLRSCRSLFLLSTLVFVYKKSAKIISKQIFVEMK